MSPVAGGAYSVAVSEIVGRNGRVYAVDLWQEGIAGLKKKAASKNLRNLRSFISDASQRIPVADQSIDVCLMATVLHDFVADNVDQQVMKEIVRVIKPKGTLAVVEYKKIDGSPGPPKSVRLSPEEVDQILSACGFKQKRLAEVGADHYLQIFIKKH
jgi:ubiquinone/menaquinone biosynthesis C-methylase UbiE